VSGATRSIMAKGASSNRVAFIFGLMLSGLVAAAVGEGSGIEPAPEGTNRVLLISRFFFGGLCVGLGTALGNGCTSGHGLTGLARLSLRSWIAVPTFMAFAVICATLTNAADSLPPTSGVEDSAPDVLESAAWAVGVALLLMVVALVLSFLRGFDENAAKATVELCTGLSFGGGLLLSGMARPSKVAGFLDLGSGRWDPSLAFVMAAALALTFPFFQLVAKRMASPVMAKSFSLPTNTNTVDRDLVLGAILFGIGWGVCGMCPGPLWLILAATPSLSTLVCWLGVLVGMGTWVLRQRCLTAPATTSQQGVPNEQVEKSGQLEEA